MENLAIKNLRVVYGDFVALDIDMPLTFNAGDRVGIVGKNGAGKSTLVREIYKMHPDDVAVHLQENAYNKQMPVKLIIEAVLGVDIKGNNRLQELIKSLSYGDCLNKRFGELSGGQKQKLTILLVMFLDKPLTFFDEVTTALDFETRENLMTELNDYYHSKQDIVFYVTHFYEELETLCNRLLVIDKGKVIFFDTERKTRTAEQLKTLLKELHK
jgi:ABC-2 type transport system ATP-binding protein